MADIKRIDKGQEDRKEWNTVNDRLKKLGVLLAVLGLAFVVGGGYAFYKTSQGARSLQAFSTAQNVTLNYNEAGQLLERGTPEDAQKIMALLTNDWGYTVDPSEMNAKDPLVNTASEYMYQMATIAYHTLNGKTTVVLDKPAEYKGQTFAAGSYDVPTAGRYWTGFDRMSPLDGPAREQAWTGTAHALIAELGVGSVTASALQIGLGMAGVLAGFGFTILLTGLGLVWASRSVTEKVTAPVLRPATIVA